MWKVVKTILKYIFKIVWSLFAIIGINGVLNLFEDVTGWPVFVGFIVAILMWACFVGTCWGKELDWIFSKLAGLIVRLYRKLFKTNDRIKSRWQFDIRRCEVDRMTWRFVSGEFRVHCPTKECAKKFLTHLHNNGITWNGNGERVIRADGSFTWSGYDQTYSCNIWGDNSINGDIGIRRGSLNSTGRRHETSVKHITTEEFFHDMIY